MGGKRMPLHQIQEGKSLTHLSLNLKIVIKWISIFLIFFFIFDVVSLRMLTSIRKAIKQW